MPRAYCDLCKSWTIVTADRLRCCGEPFKADPKTIERIAAPIDARKQPTHAMRSRILNAQEWACLYCQLPFGSLVKRHGSRAVKLMSHWDHLMPWAFSQDSAEENFAAACQVCNRIKGSRVYRTLDEARASILHRWRELGFQAVPDSD